MSEFKEEFEWLKKQGVVKIEDGYINPKFDTMKPEDVGKPLIEREFMKLSKFKKFVMKHVLPFRLYKDNGTEVVLLELDEDKENEFIDKLEKGFEIASKVHWLSIAYGIEVEITKDLTLEDLEIIETICNKRFES